MKQKIYWASIEYKYGKSEKKLSGGFVYIFLKASDVRDALNIIINECRSEKLIPVNIEFISPYDLKTKWRDDEQTKHFKKLYKAAKSANIVFDDFYSYTKS